MEDKTDLLIQIVPPPPCPHISESESEDVVTWPKDLIHLYSVYGQGSFDIFLFIFARTDENPNLTSTVETHLFLEILEQVASYDDSVIPLLKAIHSVEAWAVWGGTDNGDRCLWLAPTGDLPERVICVDSKCTEWSFYEMSVTSFLYGLLTRTIDCPMFTGDVFPTRYADMQGVSRILGRTMSTTEHFFLTPEDSVKISENWDDIGPEWRRA
jgi:hypothetical protein